MAPGAREDGAGARNGGAGHRPGRSTGGPGGPPVRLPEVWTSWPVRHRSGIGHGGGGRPARQAQSTRVSGVWTGPPLAFALSLNSA
ncbi:hypothetical protein GCM10010266_30350 [Streptomyces griseomycini]|nr:hypothetical protein GCM10010266_30350 [Streptomyces griseomycini]